VLDDELEPALERLQQAHCPGRPVEQVLLLYLDRWQFPAALIDAGQCLGRLLLRGQQLLTLGDPLIGRYYPRNAHLFLLAWISD
jgi:hypothetical protein